MYMVCIYVCVHGVRICMCTHVCICVQVSHNFGNHVFCVLMIPV